MRVCMGALNNKARRSSVLPPRGCRAFAPVVLYRERGLNGSEGSVLKDQHALFGFLLLSKALIEDAVQYSNHEPRAADIVQSIILNKIQF